MLAYAGVRLFRRNFRRPERAQLPGLSWWCRDVVNRAWQIQNNKQAEAFHNHVSRVNGDMWTHHIMPVLDLTLLHAAHS